MEQARRTIEWLEDFNVPGRFKALDNWPDFERLTEREDIDLVIAEVGLEGRRPYRMFMDLREKLPGVPILVFSQNNNEVIISQILRAGALDYLVKEETTPRQLARAVRHAAIRFQLHLDLADLRARLEVAQNRMREAQKMALLGDWTMDIVSGDVTWSDTMYDLFRLPAGRRVECRQDFIELVYDEDRAVVEAFFNDILRTGQVRQIDFRIRDQDAGFRHIRARGKLSMYDAIGGMVLVGTCQDITQEVQSRSAVLSQQLTVHSKQNQRRMMAHLGFNIRTQMGILTNLFYLLEESGVAKRQQVLLSGIRSAFDALNEDLHQFLNSTVAWVDEWRVVPQQFYLPKFLSNFKQFIELKEQVRVELEAKLPKASAGYVLMDGDKVQQVLLNVFHAFSETASLMQKPVRLKVRLRHSKPAAELSFAIEFDGYFAFGHDKDIIEETDKFLSRVASDPDKLARPDIDLAVAVRLIRILKGAPGLVHQPGKTRFEFSIPVHPVSADQPVSSAKPLFALRILLVEDNKLNQIATRKILEKWDDSIRVDSAAHGKEAIEKVEQRDYDLILMDLQMPVLGGIDATTIIRKTSDVPIVALTAHASGEEEQKCLTAGMNGYLTKPVRPKALYRAINDVLLRTVSKSGTPGSHSA